jgi:hypothetical protein
MSGICRQGFRPGLHDREPVEPEEPGDLPQEIGAAPAGLDQHDPPGRPGQLEDQARNPGATADVEEGVGRGGEDGQPEQGVQDEVHHLLGLGAVAGEPTDAVPARQLAQVDASALREVAVDVEAGRLDGLREEGPRVA